MVPGKMPRRKKRGTPGHKHLPYDWQNPMHQAVPPWVKPWLGGYGQPPPDERDDDDDEEEESSSSSRGAKSSKRMHGLNRSFYH